MIIEYKLIPIIDITEEAKHIAIEWCENYVPYGSVMPEIAQKQKLASDIMNYAAAVTKELQEENARLKGEIKDNYNAGLMCERILSKDTIERLKSELLHYAINVLPEKDREYQELQEALKVCENVKESFKRAWEKRFKCPYCGYEHDH
jgi:hypothetical protein